MRLSFDQGTLVLMDAPDQPFDFVPGLAWDPRVALWRAPAYRHAEVVTALLARGFALRDDAMARETVPRAWLPLELRPYQRGALLSWEASGQRGIIAMPTGSGKTRVALAAMASATCRTLCLVPTRALLRQWVAELGRVYSGPIGCIGDGEHVVEAVTVATFESAYRNMASLGDRFQLLVVDEVHHYGAGARDEALEMAVAPRRLGLTATLPSDASLARLGELMGPIVCQVGVAELTGTWLADFDLVLVRLPLQPDERARYDAEHALFAGIHRSFRGLYPGGSWRDFVAIASQSNEGRRALEAWRRNKRLLAFTRGKGEAVSNLLARHRDSRVLVFTADNAAAYAIARQHLIMPMTCDIARAERERALAAFRRGELRALVSAQVLNEGIDVPDADVAIIVGGTRGEREHVQRIGRLLRPAPGKRATVYELVTPSTSEVRLAFDRRRTLVSAA